MKRDLFYHKWRRLLSLLCIVVLVMTSLSIEKMIAYANGSGDNPVEIDMETVSEEGEGYTYTMDAVSEQGVVTITQNGYYILTGTTTEKRVVVDDNVQADISFQNLSITSDRTGYHYLSPEKNGSFNLQQGSKVTLTLEGENVLIGGERNAGIQVPVDTELIITEESSGKLTASSNDYGAGIGGGYGTGAGNITINGGTINATCAKNYGAGIGGGYNGICGYITINGGTINAVGGVSSAGIGGGSGDSGNGYIIINGGNITAEGSPTSANSGSGAGIGNGLMSQGGNHIIINGGVVDAKAGIGGAGIGSGQQPKTTNGSGSITINGGYITATATRYGAGIGGGRGNGDQTATPEITINGGTINAKRGSALYGGVDIGRGSSGTGGSVTIYGGSINTSASKSISPVPTNGTAQLYMTTISFSPAIGARSPIISGYINGVACDPVQASETHTEPAGYGIYDAVADDGGKVYLWLPQASAPEAVMLNVDELYYCNRFERKSSNSTATTLVPISIAVTAVGLNNLQVGTPVSNAKIVYTISGDIYAGEIYADDFTVSNLPAGLEAGEVILVDENRVEVEITGTPVSVTDQIQLGYSAIIPERNTHHIAIIPSGDIYAGTVEKGETTVALAIDPMDGSEYGQEITLTAAVSGGGNLPTGSVEFYDGDNLIDSVELTNGTAEIKTSLTAGDHDLRAVYSGDTNYLGNDTQIEGYNIEKAEQNTLSISGKPEVVTYGDGNFALSTEPTGSGSGDVKWFVEMGNDIVSIDENTGDVTVLAAGEVTVKAVKEGDDNYNQASTTIDFTVHPRDINLTNVQITGSTVYTGSQLQPEFTISDTAAITPEDYTAAYGTNITVADGGKILVSGERNYTGTKEITFNITKALPPAITFPLLDSVEYSPTLTLGNISLPSSEKGAFEWEDNSTIPKVGTFNYKIVFKPYDEDNYDYTDIKKESDIPLTVYPKAVTVTAENKEKNYGAEDPQLTYKIDGLYEGDTLNGSLKYTGTAAGSYDIIEDEPFSNPNYTVTFIKGTFTIHPRNISLVQVQVTGNTVYTGSQLRPEFTVSDTAAITSEDYTSAYGTNITVTDGGTIILTGKGNYTGTKTVLFEITKASPPAITFPSPDPVEYSPALTLGSITLPNSENGTFEWENKNMIPKVGTYNYKMIFKPFDADNFDYTTIQTEADIPITVNPKAVTVTADNKEKYFGAEDPQLTYQADGLYEGDTFNGSLKYIGTAIGSYDIVEDEPFSNPNYTVTFVKGTFTIKPTPTMDEVSDMINNLPDQIESYEDADKVAAAKNAVETLSDGEKEQMLQADLDKLKNAEEQAGEVNRKATKGEISGDELPWYVRLVIDDDKANYTTLKDTIKDKKLISAYEIYLENTLTGQQYELPNSETATITLYNVSLTGEKAPIAAYLNTTGIVEYIPLTISGDNITFTTGSFGIFGIAADIEEPDTKEPTTEESDTKESDTKKTDPKRPGSKKPGSSPKTGDNQQTLIWMFTLLAVLSVATVLLLKKRHRNIDK